MHAIVQFNVNETIRSKLFETSQKPKHEVKYWISQKLYSRWIFTNILTLPHTTFSEREKRVLSQILSWTKATDETEKCVKNGVDQAKCAHCCFELFRFIYIVILMGTSNVYTCVLIQYYWMNWCCRILLTQSFWTCVSNPFQLTSSFSLSLSQCIYR